jgi:hypothetical protein
MAVHKLMLGPEVRHDHNTLLFRKEGFPGPTKLPHYRTNPRMPPCLHAAAPARCPFELVATCLEACLLRLQRLIGHRFRCFSSTRSSCGLDMNVRAFDNMMVCLVFKHMQVRTGTPTPITKGARVGKAPLRTASIVTATRSVTWSRFRTISRISALSVLSFTLRVSRRVGMVASRLCRADTWSARQRLTLVRKMPLFCQLIIGFKNHDVTKTGSGQT